MSETVHNFPESLKKPILFLGLMGTGKSTIGALLAKKLGIPFYDADCVIEAEEGISIAEIFEKKGEPYFREIEKNTVVGLLNKGACVIAPGGGAIMNPSTAELIWKHSVSVWLNAPIETLVERTSHTRERPLLADGNAQETLSALFEARKAVYQKADIHIDAQASKSKVVRRVIKALEELEQ